MSDLVGDQTDLGGAHAMKFKVWSCDAVLILFPIVDI